MVDRITSYNTLVSAALELAEDTGTELLSYMPVAVDNAEQRLTREIDVLDFVYYQQIAVSASTPTFNKPSGHRLTYSMRYVDPTTGRGTVLTRKQDDYLDEYWPQPTSVGTPRYYSDQNASLFKIAPCTSTDSYVEVRGVMKPTGLSTSNQTNFFTQKYPDALFYATMMEVALWQRNDNLFQKFSELYIAARDSANNEGRRQRRDNGSPVNNPEPGINTLIDGGK